MNRRKVKIAFTQGQCPLFVGEVPENGKNIKMHHLLTLVSFSVKDGTIAWVVRATKGEHICGSRGEETIPGTTVTLKPSTPVTIHDRGTAALAPEFILKIDENLKVYPLSTIKKKYPEYIQKLYALR